MPSMCRSIAAWSPISIAWLWFSPARSRSGSRERDRPITPSRRVDPQDRSLGQFFQEEIAALLGLDVYIRLPESIPDSRLAKIEQPGLIARLTGFPIGSALATLNRRSHIRRARAGSELADDDQRI